MGRSMDEVDILLDRAGNEAAAIDELSAALDRLRQAQSAKEQLASLAAAQLRAALEARRQRLGRGVA